MSTLPKIIVHLGSSKCGTTSFQSFLRHHREEMLEQGILKPLSTMGLINDLGLGAYLGVKANLRRYLEVQGLEPLSHDVFQQAFEARLLEEIAQNAPTKIVFSFEGLLPRPQDDVDTIMALFRRISPDITILVSLRRHDRWAVSSYNTRLVGHGTTMKDQLTNEQGRPHGMLYTRLLGHWERHVGRENMTVFAFEDYEDVLDPYRAAIGFEPRAPWNQRQNLGISALGQEVLRRHNETAAQVDTATEREKKILRRALKAILPTGAPRLPSAAAVAEHLKVFAEDREALRGSYLPAESRFFEDIRPYPETPEKITVSDAEVADWVARARTLSHDDIMRVRSGF
ncbi:hypothetical protein ACN2XU_03970 [Primorskyibacter sp. 2E107]|uniref:hypothetical protein n=1 Tax=Primorskyibacter sp. 2E107 TaxID=3403458 RepID=UPI003AF8BFEA